VPVSCVNGDLRQRVSPLIPLCAVLRNSWLGANIFSLIWGFDVGHGQMVSSLLLVYAVPSCAWLGADYFVLFWGVEFGLGQLVSSPRSVCTCSPDPCSLLTGEEGGAAGQEDHREESEKGAPPSTRPQTFQPP
jgi:hypothetical protein